ncbi:MAG: cupin domain-containing protein [Cryomorphaceae bacterium]|nr:cupin domain-containing protein [Flavobacteriales bacterium]
MKTLLTTTALLLAAHCVSAQSPISLPEWAGNEEKNIHVEKLAGDSLTTSFMISVRDSVPTHYHVAHSEHVYVLEGRGTMWMNSDTMRISAGDYIFIPSETRHGVVTEGGDLLKVLSIQSPEFKGVDRHWVY